MVVDRASVVDGPLVEGARSVEESAGRLKTKIVDGVQHRLDCSREHIAESPVISVVVAAGVGALVGYMVGRRNS